MAFVNFHEGKINYNVKGRGRAVVLVHGFLGNSQTWKNIVPALAKKYKVITVDLPGFGKSDCFGYVHKMDFMALAIKAVMNKLLLRRYVIVGHSMGGYVSLAFAEIFSDNLRGLVLLHSTALADTEQKIKDRNKAIKVVKKNKERYLKEALTKLFYKPNVKKNPTIFNDAKAIAATCEQQGIIAALEGMKIRKNTEIVLHFSKFPVQFIMGKHDKILPLEIHKQQTELPAKSFSTILENTAHMGFDEQSNEVIETLMPFLKRSFR